MLNYVFLHLLGLFILFQARFYINNIYDPHSESDVWYLNHPIDIVLTSRQLISLVWNFTERREMYKRKKHVWDNSWKFKLKYQYIEFWLKFKLKFKILPFFKFWIEFSWFFATQFFSLVHFPSVCQISDQTDKMARNESKIKS